MILCFEAEILSCILGPEKSLLQGDGWLNQARMTIPLYWFVWRCGIFPFAAGTTDSRSSGDIGMEIQEAPDSAYALLIRDIFLVDVVARIATLALQPITTSTEARRISTLQLYRFASLDDPWTSLTASLLWLIRSCARAAYIRSQ